MTVYGSSPSHPRRPKGCESGVYVAWMNLPRQVSSAEQSESYGSALRRPHHHPTAASLAVAIDLLPRLTHTVPDSASYACARDPTSDPGHAPIVAHVPQPPPLALAPCGPHSLEHNAPSEFQRQKGPAREGHSCYGHPYYELWTTENVCSALARCSLVYNVLRAYSIRTSL